MSNTYMCICIFVYLARKVDKSAATTAGDDESEHSSNASDAFDASHEETGPSPKKQKVEDA